MHRSDKRYIGGNLLGDKLPELFRIPNREVTLLHNRYTCVKNKQKQTKMSTELALVAAKALPALSGGSLSYNPEKNVYLALGYTSAAGNTYYRAIRLSKRLAVYYHIGEGYAHTFLNGITLFCWDGQKAKIIAQKFWGGCNWRCFSELENPA